MKERAFAILRSFISGALVVIAFLNLWHFTQNLSILKARKDDAVVVWENRLILTILWLRLRRVTRGVVAGLCALESWTPNLGEKNTRVGSHSGLHYNRL